MGNIKNLLREDLIKLQDKVTENLTGCSTLEESAQKYMTILYEELSDSIILARLFATIPIYGLPEENKKFVIDLAQSAKITELIKGDTLVLSLLGTRGKKQEWDDRKKSKGHIGIPLASSDFIGKIPMMSRLLKELGAGIDWIDKTDTDLVAKKFENISGVFYVRDAATELDNKGRKIIAAQDFVEAEGVQTVFGIGGCYMGTSLFFTTIIFLSETIEKDTAERFMLQANKFKTATLNIVDEGKIFA
jgi:hypothetical protein